MSVGPTEFVDWREDFVNAERGSRLVHYYLTDSSGESHLAVVGTERSIRHMLYVVEDAFLRRHGGSGGGRGRWGGVHKWRARREVVSWLSSFLPRKKKKISPTDSMKTPNYVQDHTLDSEMAINQFGEEMNDGRTLNGHNSNITWSGVSWTCAKQLIHYPAFFRNGITIANHSFVLVMSGGSCYLAYLEDMYEDKKGRKKVKVRWFHQNQEFTRKIPSPPPHPSEVFITHISQVISADYVEDVATVLTPYHFEKCLPMLPYSSAAGLRLCFREYDNKKFKLFDISNLHGYFKQPVLSCLDICTIPEEDGELSRGSAVKCGGSKRIRSVKGEEKFLTDHLGLSLPGDACQNLQCDSAAKKSFSVKFIGPRSSFAPPFKVGEKIEVLSQDSGIRGCWFNCKVIQISEKMLKVQYDDIQNDDACENLEEWIPAFRAAAHDKLSMRRKGRPTNRPSHPTRHSPDHVFVVGTAVDAWWSDGWWEGVVIGGDSRTDDSMQVYFPGENMYLTCGKGNLRMSKEWLGDRWVDIKAKPDIQSVIPCTILANVAESGSSAMSARDIITAPENLSPRKRPRDEDADELGDDDIGMDSDDIKF